MGTEALQVVVVGSLVVLAQVGIPAEDALSPVGIPAVEAVAGTLALEGIPAEDSLAPTGIPDVEEAVGVPGQAGILVVAVASAAQVVEVASAVHAGAAVVASGVQGGLAAADLLAAAVASGVQDGLAAVAAAEADLLAEERRIHAMTLWEPQGLKLQVGPRASVPVGELEENQCFGADPAWEAAVACEKVLVVAMRLV